MGHARSVVLDELDRVGIIQNVDDDEAAALRATGLIEVRRAGEQRWQLLPCGKVGAARAGATQVEVRPKDRVGVAHLIFLLGYASDPGFRPEDVEGIATDNLWPALAESLARQVERALRHGVLQGYRTVDESLRTIRGRIRISDQLTQHPGLLLPIEVSYDEFTVDTAENQILRTALRRMLAVPGVDRRVRQRLLHLDLRLEGVSVLPHGARPPRWAPSRLNSRYLPALRLAQVVLRHSSVEPGPGRVQVASFVVSMWDVFEQFVTTALTEALSSHPGRTVPQHPTHLDLPEGGRPRGDIGMRVDVVHLDDVGRPQVVLDAKYKASSSTSTFALFGRSTSRGVGLRRG